MQPLSRRAFLAAAGLAGVAWTGYAHDVEPHWLDVGRHTVKTAHTGEPLRVLHISDLHASWCVSLEYIDQALKLGATLQPDLICVTGDFITTKYNDFDSYRTILSQLPKIAPAYASLGNHDGGSWSRFHHGYADNSKVRRLVAESGLQLLHNQPAELTVRGRPVSLVGLGDCYASEADPETAFQKPAPPGAVRIVLSHNPDTKVMLDPYPWDLVLCGHTHGGQIWLPLLGAPFAPVEDKRFIAGLYSWNGRWIHITKGVGNVWGMRFNCRPEISLLTVV